MNNTNHEMTKEIQDKLFSMLPMSEESRHDFTPDMFFDQGIPEEYHPVITIRQFTEEEKDECKSLAVSKVLAGTKKGTKVTAQRVIDDSRKETSAYGKLANACITGWKNLIDPETGKPTEYTSDAVIKRDALVGETLAEIMKISGMIPLEEQKKEDEKEDE